MQAMPDARQQSFEEIYGPPENFLEIEVSARPSVPPQKPLVPTFCRINIDTLFLTWTISSIHRPDMVR